MTDNQQAAREWPDSLERLIAEMRATAKATSPERMAQIYAQWADRLDSLANTFVLVPREATHAMQDAFFDANAKATTIFAGVPELWRAMVAAAPPRPTQERSE